MTIYIGNVQKTGVVEGTKVVENPVKVNSILPELLSVPELMNWA